jgi:VWFA-related protein
VLRLFGRGIGGPVLVTGLVAFSGWCANCCAQNGSRGRPHASSNQSPYTIPVTVRLVVIDVVVTDGHGHPVHGLKQRDFSVFENDKAQEIRSFEERDAKSSEKLVAPKLPPLPPDTYMNVATTPEWGPLYVIVDDMPDMGMSDQVWARQELAKFLASKPAGARFALFVVAEDVHLVQGFTTDKGQLLKAFDVTRKRENLPWVFLYSANYPSEPFQVLAFLGRYLEGLPGRKNVIWLSSKFPIDSEEWEKPNMQGGTKDEGGGYRPAPGTMGESYDEKVMREAIDAIDTARISLYPVDVSGVGKEDLNAEDAARVTGGRASRTNNLVDDLRDATEDGASYYEISYAPTVPDYDGKMRRIRVTVRHRNYGLEYRRYYFADAPNAPLTDDEKKMAAATADQVAAHEPGDSMFAYMEHGAPEAHGILFRAQFHAGAAAMATPEQMADLVQQPAYFVVRKNNNKPAKLPPPIPLQAYTIDYLVVDRSAEQQPGGQVLEFAAGAYDINGKLLNGISQDAVRAEVTSGKVQPFFRAQQTLEVPTTATWLRVAVRDVITDRIGTLEIPLPLSADRQVAQKQKSAAGASDPGR